VILAVEGARQPGGRRPFGESWNYLWGPLTSEIVFDGILEVLESHVAAASSRVGPVEIFKQALSD